MVLLAGLLSMAAFAVWRLFVPRPLGTRFTLLGILMNAGQAALYGWLWWRNRKLARRAPPPILEAQWHTDRSDS